jgi:hypothetical protein
MLDKRLEADDQPFARWQVFLHAHPRTRPVRQIPAVDRSIHHRRGLSGAVYPGRFRVPDHPPQPDPRHGIDHDSKPLLSPPGIRLPTSSLV